MLIFVAVLVVLALAALLLFAKSKPDAFHVQRSITIQADAEKIFPFINDLRQWAAWSPYEKRDPSMKKTHSGANEGKGAVYAWEGNTQAGAGRMEIIDTMPPSQVNIDLHMLKPFEGHNNVVFKLDQNGGAGGTNVSWVMDGKLAYLPKVLSVFLSMDQMIGKDFEAGLANLKRAAER